MGNTRLTYSYLIEHTDPPKCTDSNQLLSVKHILQNVLHMIKYDINTIHSFTDIENIFNRTTSQNTLNFMLKSQLI